MVRWRHNVPALEWERLARRMGRTATALRAWVWRNRPPRWRRHPWTESQLRRIRARWRIGVAAGWSDRKIARAAAPTLRPHSVGSVYMRAYRLGLHGQPRPQDHEESPRGPPGPGAPPTESSAWSTVSRHPQGQSPGRRRASHMKSIERIFHHNQQLQILHS